MTDWITTDEAIDIGVSQYHQQYHIESLRRLLRDGAVIGEKFGRTWKVSKSSWVSYLETALGNSDKRRGGKPINPLQT